MEEWKLKEICELIVDCPHSTAKNEGYGYPLIRTPNVGKGRLLLQGVHRVNDEVYNARNERAVPSEGDIILAREAPVGNAAIIMPGQKVCLGQRVVLIRANKSMVNPMFLVYYLLSDEIQHRLKNNANGAVVAHLNMEEIRNLKVSIPDIKIQNSVAGILSSLDDKIECNRRINDNFAFSFLLLTCFVLWLLKLINDNLEQQAQALFKSWFVDFEPFKDGEFVESEMGKTPKDLSVKRVSEIPHTIETGRRPKGGVGEISSGVPSVGAEHVKGLGNYDYSKTKYITEEYAASLKTGKVNGYELLIYKDGGKPGYFIPNYSIFGEGYPFEECFLNEHVFKLDFGDKGYNAFCYFYFWTDYVINYLNAQGGKAAIPGINRQDIENIQIFAPENELVKRFGDIVLPSIRQILFNCKESRRLSQLRDALLPRLMSGELKVNEIEMP
jgi:type I restriction enzyme S subunit